MAKTNLMLAKRYAKAFLSADLKENQTRLDELLAINKKLAEVKDHFANPAIPLKIRRELLEKVFKSADKKAAFNLVKLLLLQKRFHLLDGVISQTQTILQELKGIKTAAVASAVGLDENTKEKIKVLAQKMTDKKIELSLKQKKELLGGLQIKIDDIFIDATLNGKLKRLKKDLL
jgi:F-type H+-transporting ATPase subunit delta